MSNEGSLTLKPKSGDVISEDNPVEVGIALQSREQEEEGVAPTVEQIVITTGDNGIQDGVIEIETKDGDSLLVPIANGKVEKGYAAGTVSALAMFAALADDGILLLDAWQKKQQRRNER